jgi:hypothetical protein
LIPSSHLQAWSAKAPWPDLRQVEQDLVNSRALCDLFGSSELQGRLAFRGGTAISRAEAEQRMLENLGRSLIEDVVPLLPVGVRFEEADALRGFERVWRELIKKVSGQPWKSTDRIIEQLRTTRFPTLLT